MTKLASSEAENTARSASSGTGDVNGGGDRSDQAEPAFAGVPVCGPLERRSRAWSHYVVDVAYATGGGSALYTSSPLQRRLRDIHALTQHASVGRDFFGIVGALLAGGPVDDIRI